MTVILTLSFTLLLLSSVKKKSVSVMILIFIFMFILYGWNYWNGDYDAYKSLYSQNIFFIFNGYKYEIGYKLFMAIFNFFSFEFAEYMKGVALVSLLLIFNYFYKCSNYKAIAAIFFLFIYFPLDYVLIRNFLAFGIVLQGFIFVFKKYRYFKFFYVLFVLLASTFHQSSIFYLIFILGFRNSKLEFQRVLFFIPIVLFIYIALKSRLLYFLDIGERDEFNYSTYGQFIIFSFYQFINFLFIRYFILKYERKNPEKWIFNIIYNINLLSLFLIVFYYDTAIFIRVFRHISIINSVFIINILYSEKKSGVDKMALYGYWLFILYIFIFPVTEYCLEPLIFNNEILK